MNAYVHIPFCASHCAYCDFTSFTGEEPRLDATVGTLVGEIGASDLPGPLRTVYFGGGTPSLLPPEALERILQALRMQAAFAPDVEISLEANPESVEPHKLRAYRKCGVNRLSLGAQAFQANLLKTLGRRHDWETVRVAAASARQAMIPSINLDLMFGLPNQTLGHWEETIDRALDLGPDHLSLYALQLEAGTPLTAQVGRGLKMPDDDEQADQYAAAQKRLDIAGFHQYEVSNFSRPGHECRHNQAVWRGEDYWGFGVSAVGTVGRERRTNPESLDEYLVRAGREGPASVEILEERIRATEKILLGLRTAEGVSGDALKEAGVEEQKLQTLFEHGFLSHQEGRWFPTSRGYFVLNGILRRLLDDHSIPRGSA